MKTRIRLELEIDVDGVWPGDDAACQAVLASMTSGVVEVTEDSVLLIRSTTAEVVSDDAAASVHA